MESDTSWYPLSGLDIQDQRVVQALQIDGRAPFSRIGEVLGVSDQTVARRYGRLRSSGLLRVLGLLDPLRVGLTPWMVRVRCTPDAVGSIGDALVRREETRWVNLMSGGTEISFLAQPSAPGQDDALLLQKLPRTPRVVQMTAHAMLHVFFGQELSPVSRLGPLTPEQIAALTPADAPPSRAVEEAAGDLSFDAEDRRLLELLAVDGRTPAAELAAAVGWSATTVRRRLAELRSAGTLYYDLDLDEGALRWQFRAGLWLEVEPARVDEVGTALADHPQVAFVCATTGTANVYAAINCAGPAAFYRYLTGPVAALPGIRHTETAPIHRVIKGPSPYMRPARNAPQSARG
jgi:DNA-binding Lrp family transcriptional regulator